MGKKKTSGRATRARRGKAEAMTGAAAASVETRTAAPVQDEMVLPKPDDWDYHFKQITGYKEQVTTAQGRYRNAVKAARKAGIDVDKMNEAAALVRQNDPQAALRSFNQLNLGLKQLGFPIQLVAHDTLAGDVKEQAYKRGTADGAAGRTADNRYPEGSDLAAEYTRGWQHGTAKNLGVTPAQSDAALADQGEKWPDDHEIETAGTPAPEGGGSIPSFLDKAKTKPEPVHA